MNPDSVIHVLVAEDNRVDARLIRMAFEVEQDWPVSLNVAEDGAKALAYLSRSAPYEAAATPHLVILDWNLPQHDGIEVLQAIRRDPALKDLPVIMLSSSPAEVTEQRAREKNVAADAYLSKPFDLDEFLAVGKSIRRLYEAIHETRTAF